MDIVLVLALCGLVLIVLVVTAILLCFRARDERAGGKGSGREA